MARSIEERRIAEVSGKRADTPEPHQIRGGEVLVVTPRQAPQLQAPSPGSRHRCESPRIAGPPPALHPAASSLQASWVEPPGSPAARLLDPGSPGLRRLQGHGRWGRAVRTSVSPVPRGRTLNAAGPMRPRLVDRAVSAGSRGTPEGKSPGREETGSVHFPPAPPSPQPLLGSPNLVAESRPRSFERSGPIVGQCSSNSSWPGPIFDGYYNSEMFTVLDSLESAPHTFAVPAFPRLHTSMPPFPLPPTDASSTCSGFAEPRRRVGPQEVAVSAPPRPSREWELEAVTNQAYRYSPWGLGPDRWEAPRAAAAKQANLTAMGTLDEIDDVVVLLKRALQSRP